jgi:hypothetical protein
MAIDNNLRVDELNFDGIKTNFKRYLQAQDQFRDYNFDGSGISALLDLLAYNTYYNSFYLNMVASEAFLPTAQKRNSVVNLAKSLNYTPRSTTSATISGTLTLTAPAAPASILVPAYTEFSGTIDGKTYKFLNTVASTVSATNGVYSTTINLKEGKLITTRYTVNLNDADQRFLIQNTNVDTSTLSVSVLNSISDSTSRTFATQENLVEINSTTKVYFLEEVEDGQFEIKFGDGTFGISLDNSNIVVISYLISSGSLANDIQTLSYASTISGVTAATFVASDPAIGGNDRETISQIKFNAPKAYEAQNRVVTTEDYEALLLKQSSVDSVVVWGGEDNDPPYYGRVIISLKPYSGFTISDATKESIKNNILKSKQAIITTPVFVDPVYFYVGINADVIYNSSITTLSSEQIKSQVNDAITTYFTTNLQKFNKSYIHSALINAVLSKNNSITSALLTVKLQRRLIPTLNTINVLSGDTSIKFRNAIKPGTISSSFFFVTVNGVTSLVKITDLPDTTPSSDTGTGTLRLVNATTDIVLFANIGTVNYGTGIVSITSITPTGLPAGATDIRITGSIQEIGYNLSVSRNEILVQDDTTKNQTGGLIAGTNVTITTSV